MLAVTGGQCSKHCVLGIVHLVNLSYLCTRLICINYKGKLSYGTIKNVFHQLCLSARTDGLKRSEGSTVYGIDISEESVAKAKKVNAEVLDKRVFITQGSAEKLPYEDGKFDLVTAVETVYFWPNLADCLQEVRRVLKQGGKFAILVEVVDGDSMWTNVVEGMTAYSPEELKTLLDDAGFIQTEIHRMKPSNATIIGVKA